MRAELENPRAITDLMAMLQPGAGNGQGRGAQSSSESFESVFRNTTSSQERTEVRQPNEARNDRSQPEQNAQRGELNRRGDSESLRPRNAERPDQTSQSNEAMQQQSSEAPSVDSASVTDSIAVCEEPDVNNGASEVMNRLAELLAMDLAAVEAVMNKLGFTPEDLADPINKTAFMKAAFGLESEVQLLNIPDVAQVHQKIAEVIEKHIAEMPTAKPLPVELVANTDTAIAHALSEAIAKAKV
ncbi:MAG: hypothetical protein FWD96_00710, partial [Defluviitaleaceae bacterium]|nr:hypothetical protein [Defluviitaleaceae bacterium]